MRIQEYSIIDFIKLQRNYNIPFYQREYTWNKENIEELIDDVMDNEAMQYFLGSIVLTNKNFENRIVDGQQRVSSILLILKCLSEVIDDIDLKYTVKVSFESKNIIDGHVLQYILDDNPLINRHEGSLYYKNYKFIKAKLITLDAQELYNRFKHVMVAFVQVDERTDEHKLFAQINSTGKKLTAFDLTKNLIFGEIEDIEIQNIYLSELHESMQLIETKQYDSVLRQFRAYEYGDLITSEQMQIYHAIREVYQDKYEKDAITFLNSFIEYLSYYTFIKSQNTFNAEFYKDLFIILGSFDTFSTILIDIFRTHSEYSNGKITFDANQKEAIIASLKILQMYKIRREFVNLKEKEITRFVPLIRSRIKEIEGVSYCEKLVILLLKNANEDRAQYRMPLINEFEQAFINHPIYHTKKIARTTLIRIEFCKTKERFDTSKFSIEHMMPQTLTPMWSDMIDENTHTNFLHTIGNLSLTCSNTELSNHDFFKKRVLMNENTRLYISSLFNEYDAWNTKSIIGRAKTLFDILVKELSIEVQYPEAIPHIPINDEVINMVTFNKNKSYFKNVEPVNSKILVKLLHNFCIDGYSTSNNELEIWGKNTGGWMSQAIYDYLSLPSREYKGKLDENEFDELIDSIQEKINLLVKDINNVITKG